MDLTVVIIGALGLGGGLLWFMNYRDKQNPRPEEPQGFEDTGDD